MLAERLHEIRELARQPGSEAELGGEAEALAAFRQLVPRQGGPGSAGERGGLRPMLSAAAIFIVIVGVSLTATLRGPEAARPETPVAPATAPDGANRTAATPSGPAESPSDRPSRRPATPTTSRETAGSDARPTSRPASGTSGKATATSSATPGSTSSEDCPPVSAMAVTPSPLAQRCADRAGEDGDGTERTGGSGAAGHVEAAQSGPSDPAGDAAHGGTG